MFADMYAVHPTVPSSMTSSNSANSFDFAALLDQDKCQLLSESVTIGSLWSIDSDDTVPPFPDRPAAPITPMLLDDRSMLYPRGRSKTERDDYTILTTVATPPRMKNLFLETLRVDLWVDTITIRVAPPGHIPWEAATHITECSWVPSGSLYPPTMFKQALQSSRHANKGRPALAATSGLIEPKISRPRSSAQHGSFRKALVFEHEITLNTGGKKQRWSLQVPAGTMNPQMVDMMLELQDLNSFFKGSLEESVTVLEEKTDKIDPPSLMISDSHCAFPISLESSAHLQRGPLIPLATRRGKTLLPSLSLTGKRAENSYPSIPTAFLGSPSTYSPKFEYANAQDDPSLDLENMITNLRSQCDYPQRADRTDLELAVESPISVMSFAAPSDQENIDGDDCGDDWAFAISFLDEFGSQVPDLDQGQNGDHQNSGIKSQNTEGNLGAGGDLLLLASGPSTPRTQSPTYSPPSPIPSAPLPAAPAMRVTPVGHPSSPSAVRGILKSCKNVRFASLPGKPEEEKINTEPSPITTPTAALSVTLSPDGPSRPRTYSRSSKQLKENATILVTPRSYRPMSAYVAAGVKTEKTRPLYIAPSPTLDPLQSKKAAYSGHNRSPPRPSARHSATPVRRSAPISLGRQPLGRIVKVEPQQENENNEGTFPRSKAGLRWTMNDMTFRRGSNASQQTPEGTPKSRMPVPLRNILTRFK